MDFVLGCGRGEQDRVGCLGATSEGAVMGVSGACGFDLWPQRHAAESNRAAGVNERAPRGAPASTPRSRASLSNHVVNLEELTDASSLGKETHRRATTASVSRGAMSRGRRKLFLPTGRQRGTSSLASRRRGRRIPFTSLTMFSERGPTERNAQCRRTAGRPNGDCDSYRQQLRDDLCSLRSSDHRSTLAPRRNEIA